MTLIAERVYLDEDAEVGLALQLSYHLVLGHNESEPTEYTVDSS